MTHPEPAGFPQCAQCAYRIVGTTEICAECAAKTLLPVADFHCPICSQELNSPYDSCRNKICTLPPDLRYFTSVAAVAMYSEPLEHAVKRFKYDGISGWAAIFGRLIVGWLNAHEDDVADIDLILGNPTARDRYPLQHIEMMVDAAIPEDSRGRWPFDLPHHRTWVKLRATGRSAGGGWDQKVAAAREHAAALQIRGQVAGSRILLVDDIFTSGAQFNEVAKVLVDAGAAEVRGLVLARVPWGS